MKTDMNTIELHRETAKAFGSRENETWRVLYGNLKDVRNSMSFDVFNSGLRALSIEGDAIPDIDEVNDRLQRLTGWRGVPVTGLEEGRSFYPALARKEFPIGNFIRDRDSLGYTPAPDVFHDLYGHIPFFADRNYADFCEAYGHMASRYADEPRALEMFERFFWFTIEFGLIETPQGQRIFGAGILSSYDESVYSLSTKPEVRPFSVAAICAQPFRIDEIQPRLFLLPDTKSLYNSLCEVESEILKNLNRPRN